MKRPKRILEDISSEDIEIMRNAEKIMTVEKWKIWEKAERITRTQAKKELGEQYYRWLNRATFHMSAVQDKDWYEYYFKTRYCFE